MTRKKERTIARAAAATSALAAVMAVGTACGGGGGLGAVSGPTSPKLELIATEMRYTPSTIAVAAGDVAVVLRNEGRVIHDLHVEGAPSLYAEAAPGGTGTASWSLSKGRYRIFCALAGHRAAGMQGILEVR
jgi:uncharacterized cupredoxin-like copper-binding protein